MNCPCGEKAVSFGPFGNACPACVSVLTQNTEVARREKQIALCREVGARYFGFGIQIDVRSTPKARPAVRDPSLCSCGARASRWYEGGASCWFCVPRRTTPSERAIAYMSEVWQANLDRVEAVARRQHHRRQVLGIAKQTKDQYPVALRDWELWQVAKIQEDGRLKDVLEKSYGRVNKQLETALRKLAAQDRIAYQRIDLAAATLSMARDDADRIATLAQTNLAAAIKEALSLLVSSGVRPIDPAPYFQGPADWDAAFYKDLQRIPEEDRVDADAAYLRGQKVVIHQRCHVRGRAPGLDLSAPADQWSYPLSA